MSTRKQSAIGVALAVGIIVAWALVHGLAVFLYPWDRLGLVPALLVIALQCWLCVGLFIVAHDCMHGTLVPRRPGWNWAFGTVCLALYACFNFSALNPKHHLHHRYSGTGRDPDFLEHPPRGFWRWYVKFFGEYFSWGQLGLLAVVNWTYILVLGAPVANVLLFWALPAILSSLQLFTFGTYLPHVPTTDEPFNDRHHARSNDYPVWLSLLTCFHFGYHHEHHLHPGIPWWRLPTVHAGSRTPQDAQQRVHRNQSIE
ncbi:MAG: fatty acid desaturase [Hyphomicrobiaceae bacterium]